jgi:DNA-binding MarR family transcriptional regulator
VNPPRPTSFYRPGSYHADESIGWLMKRVLSSVLLQADRELAEHGLTHAQWMPLFKLLKGECSTAAALARELQSDPASLTRAVDRLEAKGLVRRVRSSEDRRVVELELTEEGHNTAKVVPPVLAGVLNAHLAGFSEAEWKTLVKLLQRMVVNGDAMRADEEAP